MQEIEAKFPDIDAVALRRALSDHGYTCTQTETLMRRKIFEIDPERSRLYARVRDEGHRVTMTIKDIVDDTIHGVHEAEVTIDDFDQGVLFLEMAGWRAKSYQETKREIWYHKDGIEVMIDTWPGIPTFCEIEAADAETVQQAATSFGFDWNCALFGAVDVLYAHHLNIAPEIINAVPYITFEQPLQVA